MTRLKESVTTMTRPIYLRQRAIVCILAVCLLSGLRTSLGDEGSVRIAEEKVVIPTYGVGPADPNPMFYTN